MNQPPTPTEPPAPLPPQQKPPAQSLAQPHAQEKKPPKPRLFRALLLLATVASLCSTVVFVLYLLSPRATSAERAHAHPLYLAGLIGLAVAEACQVLGVLALIVRWASHYNTERRLREILILLLSLIPYMALVLFAATVIAYLRSRRKDPSSERTHELKRDIKEQSIDIFVGEASSQSSSLASAQAPIQMPASQAPQASGPAAVRPPKRGAISRVIGPSTEGEVSRAGNWLVTLTMVAVVLATVATLGAVTPLNRLVPQQQGVALATPTPTLAIPTITPTPTPATGSVIKELAAGSDPEGLLKAPDGSVWFADAGAGEIGQLKPDGQVMEFPLPNKNNRPENLVIGPDGNIWFTEFSGNKIGRITPSGSITEYPASPTYNVFGAYDIAVGPDGNLWCTTSTDDYIDRVTPSGGVTQFKVPWPQNTSSGLPNQQPGIIAGPDGRMWFAIPELHDIGVIAMNGTITEISLGSNIPGDFTVGPDGNLWFTETGPAGSFIGRVTPAGVVTRFPLPAKSYELYDGTITLGPDGNLWFTYGHEIGRMMTSGDVTLFDPLPSDEGGPVDIITGPDGNIWLSQGNWSKIVEVAP